MAVDLHPAATANAEARLAAANAEITHLRARINTALHLVNLHDPHSGPGWTAVLLVDLRQTLDLTRSETPV